MGYLIEVKNEGFLHEALGQDISPNPNFFRNFLKIFFGNFIFDLPKIIF